MVIELTATTRAGTTDSKTSSLDQVIAFSHTEHWEAFSRKLVESSRTDTSKTDPTRRYENHLRILFNYAVERGYLNSSPMIGKLAPKKINSPKILREDEWRQLLLTAIETDSTLDLLGYVVLTLYMGLRPESEVKRIRWKNINFKTGKLFIADDETERATSRTLEIQKVAMDLLVRSKRKKDESSNPTTSIVRTGMNFEKAVQHQGQTGKIVKING